MRMRRALSLTTAWLHLASAAGQGDGSVRINEVADKGSSGTCDGDDWIELYLPDTAAEDLDLDGYALHDDRGPLDDAAFAFPPETVLSPGQYLLLCLGAEGAPQFKIGGTDEVTLLDGDGAAASTTGPLDGRGALDVTFAFDGDAYVYTTTPTPGAANIITPLPDPETVEEMRARLTARNALGEAFFNMDGDGLPADGGFPEVVDLRIEMDPDEVEKMHAERSYALYHPFASAAVTSRDDPGEVLLALPGGGRLRPKGQSTLTIGTCMDRPIPYSVDFDRGSDPDQTLFGVGRAYLRTHLGDGSFSREWMTHRSLARFALPHLRTRTVRLFFNGEYVGLYDLLEAPDQDYVHHRSFPNFDPNWYGLYKVKTMSLSCGGGDDLTERRDLDWEDQLVAAESRLDETDTPPYLFERGDHRPLIPVTKNYLSCAVEFFNDITKELEDVALAFLRKNATCGEFLVDQGLIDRDLGPKDVDATMYSFVNDHLANSQCDPGCANSNLAKEVDTTNFLKNIAVMASILHQDSPLGNGNNYYLAQGRSAYGIPLASMVQYDHNNVLSETSANFLCAPQCEETVVKWSILRPTCGPLEGSQMAGPLLTDDDLRGQYVEHVREFHSSVMTNDDFLEQVHDHLVAIQEDVETDAWNDKDAFDMELAEGGEWKQYVNGQLYIPLLPALRARAAEIKKQLAAIDAGTVPRDLDEIGVDEKCVDWDSESPREVSVPGSSGCPDGCMYDGCFRPELTVPAFCDPSSGMCIHGDVDSKCEGVAFGQGYSGIESFEGSDQTPFCYTDPSSGSIKLAPCPPKEGHDSNTHGGGGAKFICGDLALISSAIAGDSCEGGTYDDKDSNDGTTKAQCINGGGSFNAYTCEEVNFFIENDPEAKALGDDILNYLVTEWYRPKCCKAKEDMSFICKDLVLDSNATAGHSCIGGSLNTKDSNDGTTEAQCVDGGGTFNPYTCGEVEYRLENDPMVKALGKDIIDYLVKEWYQPKCCLSVFTNTPEKDSDATDEEKENTDATNEKDEAISVTLDNEEKATNAADEGEQVTNAASEEKEVTGPAPDETTTNQTKTLSAASSLILWSVMESAASFGVLLCGLLLLEL